MSHVQQHPRRFDRGWRSRWAAIGAAVAVTLGAGGLLTAQANSDESVFVAISPERILDTRSDIGLSGALSGAQSRLLDVTGDIQVATPGGGLVTQTVVPDGATAVVANVTAVRPTSTGFVSVRPGNATGEPTTSSLNIASAGAVNPNSVTVELPTTGANAGTIALYYFSDLPGGTTHLLVDVVGYYVARPSGPGANDVIPAGLTVTGEIVWDTHLSETGESWDLVHVPFPAKVSAPSYGVAFAGEWPNPDPSCTGSADAPTAPPGIVCIYVVDWNGYDADQSGIEQANLPLQGFLVSLLQLASDGSDADFVATWAYTGN